MVTSSIYLKEKVRWQVMQINIDWCLLQLLNTKMDHNLCGILNNALGLLEDHFVACDVVGFRVVLNSTPCTMCDFHYDRYG